MPLISLRSGHLLEDLLERIYGSENCSGLLYHLFVPASQTSARAAAPTVLLLKERSLVENVVVPGRALSFCARDRGTGNKNGRKIPSHGITYCSFTHSFILSTAITMLLYI